MTFSETVEQEMVTAFRLGSLDAQPGRHPSPLPALRERGANVIAAHQEALVGELEKLAPEMLDAYDKSFVERRIAELKKGQTNE